MDCVIKPPLPGSDEIASTVGSFITAAAWVNWFGDDAPTYSCIFDLHRYSDRLFDLHRVNFPNQLLRAVDKRRAEFLAGRICAAAILRDFGAINTHVGIGDQREPLWPDDLVGSISHSSRRAVAMAASINERIGIGVDVECSIAGATRQQIESQILNRDERSLLAHRGRQVKDLFTLIFSVKESFFKAAFPSVRRCFGFCAMSVLDFDADRGVLLCKINDDLHSTRLVRGQLFLAHFRYLPNDEVVTYVSLPQCDAVK